MPRAVIERAVYEQILPRLAIAAPRYYGAREEGRDFVWLFLEDLGDERFSKTDPAHAEQAARWVGAMHTGAAGVTAARSLPDGGPPRYLGHLRAGRHTIRVHIANPALTPPDVGLLERLVTDLDALERRWAGIEDACTGIPPTLTHGDVQRKNIYIRSGAGGPELFLIDWRSEEHTSELQSLAYLVCRLLLEKKNAAGPDQLELHHTPVACARQV